MINFQKNHRQVLHQVKVFDSQKSSKFQFP